MSLSLNFDNRCLRELPLDPEERNYVRQVPGAIFSRVAPTPVKNPQYAPVENSTKFYCATYVYEGMVKLDRPWR